MVQYNKQVVVVATGAANTASIVAALQRAGASVEISNDPAKVTSASHVILPGVGTFGAAVGHLRKRGLDVVLADRIKDGRPTLCVCVGLQLLAKTSTESPGAIGLNVLSVEVERFPSGVSVPQQGWNQVEASSSCKIIQSGSAFYSNSYCLRSIPIDWNGAVSVHGVKFVAGVEKGAVVALQFHPELSGNYGLGVIQRWLATEDASSPSVPLPLSTSRKVRVVPCLDVKDGRVVKGVKFADLQDAGDPVAQALEYQKQGADELVMLDISATTEGRKTAIETVSKIRAVLSIPLTVGGGISSVDDAANLLKAGADKVSVNTAAVRDPKLLTLLAERFGSQCVVLAIDAQGTTTGSWEVVVKSGKERTGKDVIAWAVQGVAQGAGEILLTSFDRDGTRSGYDLKLVSAVSKAVRVPVVASGGASSSAHMADAINAGADAVLAASIFHYGEYTVGKVKVELRNLNVPVRDVPEPGSGGEEKTPIDVKSLVKAIKVNSKNTQCLVPSIDLLGGHAVQLVGGDVSKLEIDAGDPIPIAKKFGVSGEIAVVDLDAALGRGDNTEVIKKLLKVAKCRVGGGIRTVEKAMDWLNAGATKVVIGTAATPAFLSQLPRDRVVVALDARHGEVVVEGWQTKTGKSIVECIQELKPHAGHFLVTFVEREGRMGGIDLPAIAQLVEALNNEAELTIAGGITTVEDLANLDALGVEGQVGMALYSGRLNFADAVVAPLRSDRPDGLIPTVVVDENQVALGLCYSSSVSLREAISSRRGVYWSRSRNALWVKGETSGATQELVGVAMDCDRDVIKFTVRQQGEGFCHRDTRTCFGQDSGITKLVRTIFSRKKDAPMGSYTKRLFEDTELLAAKLAEEAQELAEAKTHEDVAWEAADLLYFTLVAAAKADVTLEDIAGVLEGRSLKVQRRKGDAKPQFLKQQESVTAAPAVQQPPTPLEAQTSNESGVKLRRVAPDEVQALNLDPVDPKALEIAKDILEDVRTKGEAGLLHHAVRLGDVKEGAPYVFTRQQLHDAYLSLDNEVRALLERTAKRIRSFAVAQRAAIQTIRLNIPGGEAGHTISPMETVGCYAPGGRYPLPSTVLMTAVTARVAGVKHVWVASPHPDPVILAAAYIAEADSVLAVGGAQAIAAFAYGAGKVPRVDAIVGPGNRFVTAAKSLVAGRVAIDMLAGPSECLVLADETADPSVVAADLLAQAEHDVAAVPILVSLSESFITKVEEELGKQLAVLPTADTASISVKNNGFAVACSDLKVAIRVCDALAPEHLEVHTQNCEQVGRHLKHYGGLFLGHGAAEVLGDYGVGPNHTLPTGGSARSFGGLSVLNFLRVRTWMRIDDLSLSQAVIRDAVLLARTEGLIGHSRAAEKRLTTPLDSRGTLISEVAAAQATALSIPRSISKPSVGRPGGAPKILRLGLAKGRIMDNVLNLMKDAGIHVDISGRSLRPSINLPNYEVKLLNPRNVVEMIAHGTRDFGFCGVDLITEMDCTSTVIPYWDTGLDPVRIVAAIPEASLIDGKIPNRHLLIATEYARVTRNWIEANGLDASIVRTYGATEVFPPEDADMIVDNSATGSTLKANRLQIVDTLMTSSTHLCVHPSVFDDPEKLAMVDVFKMLLESAKLARTRVLIEFNVSSNHLEEVLQLLPSLKHPTISPLSDNAAFAVKAAVPKQDIVSLIPKIKAHGGSDVLLTEIKQLVC